jgi:hypothetical protein
VPAVLAVDRGIARERLIEGLSVFGHVGAHILPPIRFSNGISPQHGIVGSISATCSGRLRSSIRTPCSADHHGCCDDTGPSETMFSPRLLGPASS